MWQLITFDEEEAASGPAQLEQFSFDLMCAEVFQEEGGLWVAALIDTDGNETWTSEGKPTRSAAMWTLNRHLQSVFDAWLKELRV